MTRLYLLTIVLSVSGCLFNDCSFDVETLESAGFLRAEAGMVGDTLTVAFVDTFYPSFDVFVRTGYEANPAPSEDGSVRLGFDSEALVFQNSAPPQFDVVAVGDTAYVYVVGTLDPSIFSQTCSPPEERVRLDVEFVSAPATVKTIRTARLNLYDFPVQAARALRQRDARRPTSV